MKSLFLVIPTIRQGGGAARVFMALINNLDRSKYKISLVVNTLEKYNMPDLPEDVDIFELGFTKSRYSIFVLCKIIYKHKPDIVLSTMGHFNLLIGLFKILLPNKTTFIARETNTVSIKNKFQPYPKLFDFMYKVFYKKFDCIIAQSNYMKDDLIKNYKIPKEKIIVINNPIDTKFIDSKMSNVHKRKHNNVLKLIAIGSISYQKGYDLLIRALALLKINFHIEILGEGKLDNEMRGLIKKYSLSKKVDFTGYVNNPYEKLANANIMLLSSRYEGFPNSVLEANYCGVPVVAFNSPGGVSEIIKDGFNGFLVNNGDCEDFANKIVYASEFNFDSYSISKKTKEKYKVDSVIIDYEMLFDSF